MGCVCSDQKHKNKEKQVGQGVPPEKKIQSLNNHKLGQQEQQVKVESKGVKFSKDEKIEDSYKEYKKAEEMKVSTDIDISDNNKQAMISKYNISVKDFSNKVLSINTYDYQGLRMSNPNTLQVK